MRLKVAKDRYFSSNHILGGDFGFDCLTHYKDIVHLGRYLVHIARQIRAAVERLRNVRRGLPGIISG